MDKITIIALLIGFVVTGVIVGIKLLDYKYRKKISPDSQERHEKNEPIVAIREASDEKQKGDDEFQKTIKELDGHFKDWESESKQGKGVGEG